MDQTGDLPPGGSRRVSVADLTPQDLSFVQIGGSPVADSAGPPGSGEEQESGTGADGNIFGAPTRRRVVRLDLLGENVGTTEAA